jgi:hypothetical protein
VPEGAEYRVEGDIWELATRGADGKKAGDVAQWRSDGTLYLRGKYQADRLEGEFTIFHPTGQVARQGKFVGGERDGEVISYACEEESPEPLRACCVPDNAWQMKSRYLRGQLEGETFYDRQGRVLLSDGTLRPERPAALPEDASFDEYSKRWGAGGTDERGLYVGPWRFWTAEGTLDEEAEYRETRKIWSRLHDPGGGVRLEVHFVEDGVRHGPYRRVLGGKAADGSQGPDDESPYADPRIREERGAFHREQRVGPWTFLDAGGAIVRAVDYGPAHDEAGEASAVFLDGGPAGGDDDFLALAATLRAAGRVREAVCAVARAAGRSGSTEALVALLAEVTVPVTPETGARLVAGLAEGQVTVARVLDALLGGADPASVLRTLASIVKGASRASHDFIQAAILLAPERPMAYMTRALILLELGDDAGARADAERVEPESSEAASFLRAYVRVLFPELTFWPRREIPHSPLEDMPEAPAQPLPAVRRAIQLYATRIGLIRAALAALCSGSRSPAWLPPDLGRLLPDGPLPLAARTAQIVDETDEGTETTEVKIDETLRLDGLGVPALMRLCRVQWAGLCWLCWSAGLDEVGLPDALAPPANFDQAAGMVIARYWRAQDAVVTGGLRSLSAGVPSFVWEEQDLDGLPRHFAEMVQDEYLEMRAVFLFLASGENLSPFQSDLRQA